MKDKIHKALTEYPEEVENMILVWWEKMPEQAEQSINEIIYGCHIATQKAYECYINKLPSIKWSFEDIMNVAKIDFSTKQYYEYDFAFLMNYLYILFHDKFSDYSYYIFMAKAMLENEMMEDSDDMAYELAKRL